MELKETIIGGRKCYTGKHGEGAPEYLLLQATDEHEAEFLEHEVETIEEKSGARFGFAAFQVKSWNDDLSPWEAPPVFGNEPFGSGAEDTLRYIQDELVPEVSEELGLEQDVKIIIGGYSLSAFFALWSMVKSGNFAGAAASSPSVWFPGWIDLLADWADKKSGSCNIPVYLSLGNKEPKTKNPLMQTVGDRIEETFEILKDRAGCDAELEWNQGNHFKEPDIRTAKGFAWCLNRLSH